MTKKELSRRALYEHDKVVIFISDCFVNGSLRGFNTTDLLNQLQRCEVVKGVMEINDDNISITTRTAVFKCYRNKKNYPTIDSKDIFVNGLGTFSFEKLLKMRGEGHCYQVKLINNDEETEPRYFCVETTKTLKQFEKAYYQVRNRWFKEKSPCGLDEYLDNNLYELGFGFFEITPKTDLEVAF